MSPKASRAILIPPDAEPVAPANKLTAIASDIRGVPGTFNNISVSVANPGTDLTTVPNPTAPAVLRIAVIEPMAPLLIVL